MFLRFNNSTFMNKTLRKAIMHRSKSKNICSRNRTIDNWANYKKQQTFCVNLRHKTKSDYFQNWNIRDLSDNKKFWKTINPYFSNKRLSSIKLFQKETGNLVLNEKQLANIVNNFFINITKDLELKEDNSSNADTFEDVLKFSMLTHVLKELGET